MPALVSNQNFQKKLEWKEISNTTRTSGVKALYIYFREQLQTCRYYIFCKGKNFNPTKLLLFYNSIKYQGIITIEILDTD